MSSSLWWPAGALALALVAGGAGWALRGESARDSGAQGAAAAQMAAPAASTAASVPASAASQSAENASAAETAVSAAAAAEPAMTLAQFMSAQKGDDGFDAWKLLASHWNLKLTGKSADPCPALARGGVQCYRNRKAGLGLVRQLNRPVLMTLVSNTDGQPVKVSAVLSGLNESDAWLEGMNGSRLTIPVSELAAIWHGEITTLWRAPKALADGADPATNPAAQDWLDEQLARSIDGENATPAKAAPGKAASQRRARIRQFQLAQGLTPDGQAGPLTLMLLNRAAGVTEPRLRTGA